MSAEGRRQQLVDVGWGLLANRPIQDLTLEEVAVEVGVSRTLVFHYFPSKGDYFAAVVLSAGDRLMQAVPRAPALGDGADPRPQLSSMVEAFLGWVSRKSGAYVALVRSASGGDPKVLAALDEVRSDHALRWLEAASWPHSDPITLIAARAWLASLEEVAFEATASDLPPAALVELLVEGLLEDLSRAQRLAVRFGASSDEMTVVLANKSPNR